MFDFNTVQSTTEIVGKAIASKEASQEAGKEALGIGINSSEPKGNTDGIEIQSQKEQQNIEEQANQNNKKANLLLSTLFFGGALSSLFASRGGGYCGSPMMGNFGSPMMMGGSMCSGSPDPYFFSGNPALGTSAGFGCNVMSPMMGNGYYGSRGFGNMNYGSTGAGVLSGVLAGVVTYFAIKGLSGNKTKDPAKVEAKEERQAQRAEKKEEKELNKLNKEEGSGFFNKLFKKKEAPEVKETDGFITV